MNLAKNTWYPIMQVPDEVRDCTNPLFFDVLLKAPELTDLDFNPRGVSVGYWDAEKYGWVAAGFDGHDDTYQSIVVCPTHFMIISEPGEFE